MTMSSTLDRLRRLQTLRPQRAYADPEVPTLQPEVATPVVSSLQQGTGQLEVLVPGAVIENVAGTCYVHTQLYPLHTTRGPHQLGGVLAQLPHAFAPFHPSFGLTEACDFRRAIFLDTETTGLGGGAGIYCFMVGVGVFEALDPAAVTPSHFVMRQYFMRSPAEEGALLLALAELLDQHGMSVTFNGRTFDLPLLRARLNYNQRIYPDLRGTGRLLAPDRPHLDLLHPARRLWRRRLQSCRLINLEEQILGLQRSESDVPGQLIPQLYHDYVQHGDATQMQRVFYHNHEDVLSMVALAERLCLALTGNVEPNDARQLLQREDWLALGVCYEDQNQLREAEAAYRRALELLRDPAAKAETFQRLGNLLKRQARWSEAADLWQLWLTSLPSTDATPYIELAKYCEWQLRDLEQAEMWTGWALHNVHKLPAWQRTPGQLSELEHRITRLQRKRGGVPAD